MKIDCPFMASNGDGKCHRVGCGYKCNAVMQIDINIPTSDLIAELEKRRPCKKCKDYQQIVCGNCVWDSLGQEDNFKEAK